MRGKKQLKRLLRMKVSPAYGPTISRRMMILGLPTKKRQPSLKKPQQKQKRKKLRQRNSVNPVPCSLCLPDWAASCFWAALSICNLAIHRHNSPPCIASYPQHRRHKNPQNRRQNLQRNRQHLPATTNSAETDIGAFYKPAGTPTPVTMPPSSTAIETTPSPLPSTSDTATGLPAPVAPPSSTTAQGSQTAVKSSVNPASGNPNAMAPTQPQSNPTNPVPPMPGQVLHPQPAMNTPSVAAVASNEHVDAQQLSRLNALTARIDVLQKSLDPGE